MEEKLRNKLIDWYYKEGLSPGEIADKIGRSRSAVYFLLRKYGLPLRGDEKGRKLLSPACPKCGSHEAITLVSANGGSEIIRYRICRKCKYKFRTKEVIIGRADSDSGDMVSSKQDS
ncbi:MAG: hypothetical protein DRH57_00220 [Candidatus Cloacimonadota bacterium]|nr:MAG: hypothetical protein DRH57_00220 [Candidatus Cloacimonadota bacterium]